MKKINMLLVFVLLIALQAVAVASSKNIDLREYQQATGTVNVLAAPFQNDNYYIATFNFNEQIRGNNINFYQGTCIVNNQDKSKMQPLLTKKVKANEDSVEEVLINKKQQMPYLQDFKTVQTTNVEAESIAGNDTNNIVFLGKFKVITAMGTFDDCIGIKIFNEETGEGMIQYLAKGCGVVYMEGVQANGMKTEIARLTEIRPLTEKQIQEFKNKYFAI